MYRIIERYEEQYSVVSMCKFYGVSRSGYYGWRKRTEEDTKDQQLHERIAECQRIHKKRYGYRRVVIWLARTYGQRVNHKAVLRIMRKYRLLSEIRRRRVYGLRAKKDLKYRNLLAREFASTHPNEKWVTDITLIQTKEGFLYLSAIEDLHGNFVISYAMDERQEYALVDRTLRSAVEATQDTRGLLIHSDQGCQYTSYHYRDRMKEYGMIPSMSNPGTPHDNACMENFFSVLKTECIYREKPQTIAEAQALIAEFVYYYNYERIQTRTKMTPYELRRMALPSCA